MWLTTSTLKTCVLRWPVTGITEPTHNKIDFKVWHSFSAFITSTVAKANLSTFVRIPASPALTANAEKKSFCSSETFRIYKVYLERIGPCSYARNVGIWESTCFLYCREQTRSTDCKVLASNCLLQCPPTSSLASTTSILILAVGLLILFLSQWRRTSECRRVAVTGNRSATSTKNKITKFLFTSSGFVSTQSKSESIWNMIHRYLGTIK